MDLFNNPMINNALKALSPEQVDDIIYMVL